MRPLLYLVDTDWVVSHLNNRQAVTKRLLAARSSGLAVSVISLAELWDGILFSNDPLSNERALQTFLQGVDLLGITPSISRRFGQLRGSLRQEGRLIPDFDLLIAATALEHNLILLSNNRRHFEQVVGLRLESISE